MYLLITTFPNKPRDCKKFILGLVKSKMASCVQKINYVKSYYMREGQLKQEQEQLLIIKGPDAMREKITGYITKNHPYDIPEIIFLKPEEVSEAYEKRVNK